VANHPQALKRHRQSLRRRARNRQYKTMMKNAVKKLRTAIDESADAATVEEFYRAAASTIDRVAQKGAIKQGTASRRIARLALHVSTGPRVKATKRRRR